MADIWSYCSECERWYYCAPAASNRCPVCESEPSATEDRAASLEVSLARAPMAGSAKA